MRSIILQHTTAKQAELLALCQVVNRPYAEKFGFEYVTDLTSRCPERYSYWEKLAFFLEYLPTIEDGSFVVWEDVDVLNVGDGDFHLALPEGELIGMVPLRFTISNKIRFYFNAGVIVMINCPEVRSFWERVVARYKLHRQTEPLIVEELLASKREIAPGKKMYHLDIKWNVWKNNAHLCDKPVARAWHSLSTEKKLPEMRLAVEQFARNGEFC